MPLDHWTADGLLSWIEHLDDRGVFVTDRTMAVRSWNRWLSTHTGRSPADVIGRSIYDIYPELLSRGFDSYYAAALAGEPRVLSERFHRHLLPLRRTVAGAADFEMAQSVRIEPLRIDNAVAGTITVIEDVTDRVITERELRSRITGAEHAREVAEHASHLKDEFLGTLSHEIRTPLNAVIGWARVLRRRSRDRNQQAALSAIERNGLKQLRLVDDLLGMSRVISGRLRLTMAATDVASVAHEIVAAIRSAAEAKALQLEISVDEGLPPISADAARLQQALWQLVANAVKFTPPRGTVRLTITRSGDRVIISVRDDGVGIAAEFIPFVFELFRQGDATPARRHDGLGLGLTLARRIIELHGGDVGVESAGVDRGALFWIALPIVPPVTHHPPAPPIPAVITLAGIDVLVACADDDARELTAALLGDYGATVRAVPSAAAVLAALRSPGVSPDAVVIDVENGAIDGIALLRDLRLASGSRGVMTIAIGSDATNDRIRALAAGFAHYLAAPVEPGLLAAAVGAAAREWRRREEGNRERAVRGRV